MTSRSMPSIYEILDIDGKETNKNNILKKLNEQKKVWSAWKNQGTPKQKAKAENYFAWVNDIEKVINNSKKLNLERENYIVSEKQKKRDSFKILDDMIDFLGDNYISEDEHKAFLKNLKGKLEESDIDARLKKRRIIVGKQKSSTKRVKKPKLEASKARAINEKVTQLGKKNLYDFLELRNNSSCGLLKETAHVIWKNTHGKTDTENSRKSELAGIAEDIFDSNKKKEKYDNVLSSTNLSLLDPFLKLAGADGVLTEGEMSKLLKAAKKKNIDFDDAKDYIIEISEKRKWKVLGAKTFVPLKLLVCGYCGELAAEEKQQKCTNCGEEFMQPCPLCKNPTPTEHSACSKCGCTTGDAPLIHDWLKKGKEYFTQGDFVKAEECFDRTLIYWKGWRPALEEKKRTQEMRDRREIKIKKVERLIQDVKLEEAQSVLEQLIREFGRKSTESLTRKINVGISNAERVFRDAESLHKTGRNDNAVIKCIEAKTYCADFRPAMRMLADSPPPAPSSLTIMFSGSTAQISWTGVTTIGNPTYRVQRKRATPPTGPEDGITIREIQQSPAQDTSVPVGIPWYYSIFTLRGGIVSTGISSGPHMRLTDPTEVSVKAGDHQVTLHWKRPVNCTSVEVWRETSDTPRRKISVTVSGDSAVDHNLKNDTIYFYLIVACFNNPKGNSALVKSSGIRIEGRPIVPPPAIEDLRAEKRNHTVLLSWTSPMGASVQIRQTLNEPNFSSGKIIPLSSVNQYGTPIPVTQQKKTQTILDIQGRVFFIPLSIKAQTAVLGKPVAITTLDEVSSLKSDHQDNTINLTWVWPKNAAEAVIMWQKDDYPTNPNAAIGGSKIITRNEYNKNAMFLLKNAARTPHYFTVFIKDPNADIYSSGVNVVEACGNKTDVTYKVVTQRWLFFFSIQKAWIEFQTKENMRQLPPIVVVLQQNFPPIRKEKGMTITTLASLKFDEGSARIDLDVDIKGYIKVFFQDGEDAKKIHLIPAAKKQLKVR